MRTDLYIVSSAHLAEAADPITALLTRDWAAVGGWSLFIGLALAIVLGSFRETWVPGNRYRRAEARAEKAEAALKLSQETLEEALSQNSKLLSSSQIVEYVLKEFLPKLHKPEGGNPS